MTLKCYCTDRFLCAICLPFIGTIREDPVFHFQTQANTCSYWDHEIQEPRPPAAISLNTVKHKTGDSEFSWNMRSLENNFCFSWPCPLHSNLPFTHPLNRPHTPCSLNLVATPTRLRLAHTKPHMGYIPRFPSLWLTTQATIFYRPAATHLHILQFSFFFDWLLTKFFFNAGLLAKQYSCHVWTGT